MIKLYTDQGKDVVLLNTLIDANFISFLEYRRARREDHLQARGRGGRRPDRGRRNQRRRRARRWKRASATAMNDRKLAVQLKPFKSDDMIAMITVDEQNRRFYRNERALGRPRYEPAREAHAGAERRSIR